MVIHIKVLCNFQFGGGKNGTWDINSNTTDAKTELKLGGNLFMKFFNNNNEIWFKKNISK